MENMIYSLQANCNKHHWLKHNKSNQAIITEKSLDIWENDKKQAKLEIDELIKCQLGMEINNLTGDEHYKCENTLNMIENNQNILIKNGCLKNFNNNYYIDYKYLYKHNDDITIFFILYKDINKIYSDYNTKQTIIPRILYSKDILESYNKFNIKIKAIYLDINEFKIADIDINRFKDNDINKCLPLYYDIENTAEQESIYSRKCKKCEFRDYCNVPKMSIADLEHTQHCWRKLDPIIKENKTLDLDSLTIEQENTLAQSHKARLQAYRNDNGIFIDKEIINNFLDKIKDGYISFDFETYSSMKPFDKRYTNYSQIPFSFSSDVVNSKNEVISNKMYLTNYKDKNFNKLISNMVKYVPQDKPIVVYFKTFEITRLKEMKELYPKYAEAIDNYINNIVDLYDVFNDGGYYDINFNNSISLKNVYPVLCNSNKYDNLSINHGDDAAIQYKTLFETKNENIAKDIKRNLRKYNRLDTLAQVEIIEKLKELTAYNDNL